MVQHCKSTVLQLKEILGKEYRVSVALQKLELSDTECEKALVIMFKEIEVKFEKFGHEL